jgi:adenosylhomocysteine nucleosidase
MAAAECVAVIAALPREIAGLVKGLTPDTELRRRGVWLYRRKEAVVVAAGMGAARAAIAVEAAMSAATVGTLMSVGIAGACDPKLRVGDLLLAGVVVDARTGERFEDSQYRQVLVTSGQIASVAEKRRLLESYSASAVDMEAAAVGRLARAHGLGFAAIKAISDEADFELPALGRFATSEGQFREAAFAAYAAVHPAMWGKVMALAGHSKRAIAALTLAVEDELAAIR